MIEQIIEQLNVPGDLLYLTQYGSHLYGTNTENSDLDYRGIFIPKIRDLVLKRDVDEYNTELNMNNIKVDVKLFSIHKFIKLYNSYKLRWLGSPNMSATFSTRGRERNEKTRNKSVCHFINDSFVGGTYCLSTKRA